MNNIIIDKIQNKINSAIRSRSSDIKISLDEANQFMNYISQQYSNIIELQEKIITLQSSSNTIELIAEPLTQKK